jgi:hypothetical protein
MVGQTPFARPKLAEPLVVGIPYSVVSTNDLKSCATIESGAYTISRAGLELSLRLWLEIERINGNPNFRVKDLPRIPYPLNSRLNEPVLSELQRLLDSIP